MYSRLLDFLGCDKQICTNNWLPDAKIRRYTLVWKDLDYRYSADKVAFIESKEMTRGTYKGDVFTIEISYKK